MIATRNTVPWVLQLSRTHINIDTSINAYKRDSWLNNQLLTRMLSTALDEKRHKSLLPMGKSAVECATCHCCLTDWLGSGNKSQSTEADFLPSLSISSSICVFLKSSLSVLKNENLFCVSFQSYRGEVADPFDILNVQILNVSGYYLNRKTTLNFLPSLAWKISIEAK